MKRRKVSVCLGSLLLAALLGSCVSLEDKPMTPQERNETEILGSLTVTFNSYQFCHIPNKPSIKAKAYPVTHKR
jgi:hypothetical protein